MRMNFNSIAVMKKLMKSLMLFAAAAMALTSCENEAMNEGIEANDTFTLSFTADAPESKTSVTINDNVANFAWSEGDQVAFIQWANGADKINKKKSEEAVIAENGSATFTSKFEAVEGTVTSYDYAAIYPDANWKSNTDFSEVTAVVPSTQTLTENNYDPAADLMMSQAILGVENKDGHGGNLKFHRLAAIGRMNLKGIPAGEIIQTVTITFEKAVLNGNVTINFTKATAAYATTGSNVVTLNNGNLTAVAENPIFFTCFPGEYTGAYTFDVETDKAYYQKTGTINAEKPLTFTAGNVMGFSTTVAKTADKATDKVYTKVTKNNLADYSGEYLLVYEEGGIAFDGSLTTLDAANNGFVVTISDNTITGDYTAKAFTIAKVEGGYSIKSASNKYIGSNTDTGNKLYTAEEYDANYLNTIENLIIKGSAGAPLQYNPNSSDNRFRYYYKAGQQSVALYRLNGTGSDEELVRALESIEVTGATTTFTVNDEFVFGGTVTAKYNDNTTETVDAAYYTVDRSAVKMDTAGTYTVNVTYEGKTATYTITVSVASAVVTKTVTYTVTSTSAVSVSGEAPAGASATYNSTYSNKYQLTKNNSMTLTLSNYAGVKITGLTMSMRSNASGGAGNYSMSVGNTTISSIATAKFNTASWNGAWSTSYVDVTPSVTATTVGADEDIVITIAATVNSLYCQSFTLTYEVGGTSGGGSETPDPTPDPEEPVQLGTPDVQAEVSGNTITLTWADDANASSYTVTYGTTTIENATSPCEISNLTYSTLYNFTVVAVGDGTNYTNSEAGTASATTEADPNVGGGDVPTPTTVEMDIKGTTGTLAGDSNSITWTSGDVTFTNIKGGTAIRTSDSNHYRAYSGSGMTISVAEGTISKVVITCVSGYQDEMETSFTNAGYTVSTSGTTVTVTGSGSSFTATASAQTRLSKIAVTYTK